MLIRLTRYKKYRGFIGMKFHLPCHVLSIKMSVPPSPLATTMCIVLLSRCRGGANKGDAEVSLRRLDYLLLQRCPRCLCS